MIKENDQCPLIILISPYFCAPEKNKDNMKTIAQFKTPKNLTQIVKEESYWENDSFEPFYLSAEPVTHKGKEVIAFQISFPPLEDYEEINGCKWESIIFQFVKDTKPELSANLYGKSVEKECILWVDSEPEYKHLLNLISELLNDPDAIEDIYRQLFE